MFHEVQGFSVRRAKPVDHGEPADLDAHGIDQQFVAFVMADRIPIPGRGHLSRVRLVHPHLSELMIERV